MRARTHTNYVNNTFEKVQQVGLEQGDTSQDQV